MNKTFKMEILKEEKRLVYGIVLKPEVPDLHDHIISADEIEKSAHTFMMNYQIIGEQHEDYAEAKIVESYIAPVDMEVNGRAIPKGAWVMVVKVLDDKLWAEVKKGKYTAFSTGGIANAQEI